MKEYIEREAVLQQFDIVDTVLKDDCADSAFKEFAIKISIGAVGIIKAIPAADVVEVRHGRWIVLAEFFDKTICTQCSVCGEEYTYKTGNFEHINASYAKYNYCPNCGAKMDKEE